MCASIGKCGCNGLIIFVRETLTPIQKSVSYCGSIWVNSQLCYVSSALKGQKRTGWTRGVVSRELSGYGTGFGWAAGNGWERVILFVHICHPFVRRAPCKKGISTDFLPIVIIIIILYFYRRLPGEDARTPIIGITHPTSSLLRHVLISTDG